MAMTAKVENYLNKQRRITRSICIDRSERACVNCIWFEQHYRENRGNIRMYTPISSGYCLLHEQKKGAMTQPCKDFETKEGPA